MLTYLSRFFGEGAAGGLEQQLAFSVLQLSRLLVVPWLEHLFLLVQAADDAFLAPRIERAFVFVLHEAFLPPLWTLQGCLAGPEVQDSKMFLILVA